VAPPHTYRLGNLDLHILSDGTFFQDAGAVFGVVPRIMWERVAPPLDEQHRIPLGLNCLLVRSHDKLVLIETGVGDKEGHRRQASPAADGTLRTSIEIPNNVGGWHSVQLYQSGKLQAEASYYVRQKLLGVTPTVVKAGEMFTIRVRGVGWTELDNGFAVTYDNAYAGFACGFYEKGDVKLNLYATGGPGTHLIDFYPMIYKGKSTDLWNQQLPMLAFRQDNPGLALGYKLPAMRIAIRVVK